mgnify:CR=1 FL=1
MTLQTQNNLSIAHDVVFELTQVGRLLSQQPNLGLLLETILETSQKLLNADGATLYHVRNEQFLTFQLLRNKTLSIFSGGQGQDIVHLPDIPLFIGQEANHKSVVSHCTLTKKTINIPDAYNEINFDFSQTKVFDKKTGYRTQSVLAIPILNHQGQVIAVMQFINCAIDKVIVPFSNELQSIAEALASQAGVAIENRLLIDQLSNDLAKEIDDATQYINSLLPAPIVGEISTSWQYIPSSGLGGDAFGYHWIDENHFAIYLLDVCGHGVGSALMSVSAMNVLRAQSLKNVDFLKPASVLRALNNIFLMESHDNKFFTLWYGVYDKQKRQLTFSSAGHPPAYLVNTDSLEQRSIQSLHTPNIAIGYMQDFEFKESVIPLKRYVKLYVYSDGVFEIEKANKEMLSLEEFNQHMSQFIDPTSMESAQILKSMEALKNNTLPFADDYSFLEIIF